MKLGYIRVSTVEQNEERQTRALLDKGVEFDNLYIDCKYRSLRATITVK